MKQGGDRHWRKGPWCLDKEAQGGPWEKAASTFGTQVLSHFPLHPNLLSPYISICHELAEKWPLPLPKLQPNNWLQLGWWQGDLREVWLNWKEEEISFYIWVTFRKWNSFQSGPAVRHRICSPVPHPNQEKWNNYESAGCLWHLFLFKHH